MRIKKEKRQSFAVPILPRETVEIAERAELLLSGVTGIEEYSRERICVKTGKGTVVIDGKGLLMCWAGEKKLMLRGCIRAVVFGMAGGEG